MNTLVLRADLSGDPTFRELLHRAQLVTAEAFQHRNVPFERVVEAVRPLRPAGRAPLFEAMLVLNNARLPELSFAGLDLRPVDVDGGAAVTDLALILGGERLGGALQYDAARFDATTADQLLDHLRNLLEGAVADPSRPLSELPLLSPAERHRLLVEWNDTAADLGEPQCLHETVEGQARRSPQAVAVASEAGSLTYEGLSSRANALAHRLRRAGVAPDRVVGVCMERSPDAVVAILGTLKAGGAYLPLDPGHPPDRLRFLLDDAEVAAVVTSQRLRDRLPASPAPVVVLDGEPACGADDPPPSGVTPDSLAYVIFTSGSTGAPKGVCVPHRAVINHLRWRQRALPLDEADAVLQRTPLVFDPSVWELFGPLSAGARLVLPRPGADEDGAYLVRLVAAEGVTVLQAVPSVLEALLDDPRIADCRTLRLVVCGGETLRPDLVERFRALLPGELHHVYGPTEAAIEATHWRCGDARRAATVPIGRPIANVTAHVLDPRLAPVPVGVAGELCIGGAGLARGYLNRPELTQRRFVANPFDDVPGERLYRTGDLARRLPDGTLEFLGRADEQIKVRGVRVEPGEVEAALARHRAVEEVAVTAVDGGEGRRLLAVVVPSGDPAPDADELTRFAAQRLPDVMVPAEVVCRAALPRTPTGKVDRARLAADARAPRLAAECVAPRDAVELELQRIWQALLPDRPVGVTDDFFELGGHSLLAMRVIAQIHKTLGAELPLSSLIEERTIERLACLLREPAATRSPLVGIQPEGAGGPLFCVHPVGGTVLCYLELARALGDARPVYGIEAVGLREGEEPHARIEDMASAYLEAIRDVQPAGPYVLAGWSMGGMIAFEMARQLEARGERIALLALLDTRPPAPEGGGGTRGEEALLESFAQSLGLPPDAFSGSLRELRQLDDDAQLAHVLEQARSAGLVTPDTGVAGLRRQLRVFTRNLRALGAYAPRPCASQLALIEAGATQRPDGEAATGWEGLAGGGVLRVTVDGDHYTMLRRPNVEAVAAQLETLLGEARLVPS